MDRTDGLIHRIKKMNGMSLKRVHVTILEQVILQSPHKKDLVLTGMIDVFLDSNGRRRVEGVIKVYICETRGMRVRTQKKYAPAHTFLCSTPIYISEKRILVEEESCEFF